jgi:hypothetical protein
MKQFFSKASVVLMVFALAVVATSCNSYDDEQTATKTETITVKNSLRGVILDQNGAALTGATVTINGKSATVTGNTFESLGLNDGTYKVVAKCPSYKDGTESVTLATSTQTVEGETVVVGQDAVCVIYLTKEETKTVQIGSTSDTQTVVLETSQQDDGTGTIVPTTQEDTSASSEISVTANVPGLNATQVADVEKQLPAGLTISDLKFNLINLASLAEAATRQTIVAGDALPGNYTFITGVTVQTEHKVDFSAMGVTIDIAINLPGDVKNAIKLFRYVDATTGWTEVTAATTGAGIAVTNWGAADKIVVSLNVLETQSYAIGALIDQSEETTSTEAIEATPVVNNSATAMSVPSMNYTAKSRGVVLTNLTQGAMVDYLRKVVLRYYSIKAIKEAKDEVYTYTFKPKAYTLAVDGQLFLSGFQTKKESVFKISNGTSSFKVAEFGDVFVYPYAVVPDVTREHGGGSND